MDINLLDLGSNIKYILKNNINHDITKFTYSDIFKLFYNNNTLYGIQYNISLNYTIIYSSIITGIDFYDVFDNSIFFDLSDSVYIIILNLSDQDIYDNKDLLLSNYFYFILYLKNVEQWSVYYFNEQFGKAVWSNKLLVNILINIKPFSNYDFFNIFEYIDSIDDNKLDLIFTLADKYNKIDLIVKYLTVDFLKKYFSKSQNINNINSIPQDLLCNYYIFKSIVNNNKMFSNEFILYNKLDDKYKFFNYNGKLIINSNNIKIINGIRKHLFDTFISLTPEKYTKHNKKFILALISQYPKHYKNISDYYKIDKDIIRLAITYELSLLAVSNSGQAIQYLKENYKKNYKINLTAVTNSGIAIKYCDKKFKHTKKFALTAIQQYGDAIYYLPQYWNDYNVVMTAIKNKSTIYIKLSDNFKMDHAIALNSIICNYDTIYLLPEQILQDLIFIKKLLKINKYYYKHPIIKKALLYFKPHIRLYLIK